jgi:hypothetical protein
MRCAFANVLVADVSALPAEEEHPEYPEHSDHQEEPSCVAGGDQLEPEQPLGAEQPPEPAAVADPTASMRFYKGSWQDEMEDEPVPDHSAAFGKLFVSTLGSTVASNSQVLPLDSTEAAEPRRKRGGGWQNKMRSQAWAMANAGTDDAEIKAWCIEQWKANGKIPNCGYDAYDFRKHKFKEGATD